MNKNKMKLIEEPMEKDNFNFSLEEQIKAQEESGAVEILSPGIAKGAISAKLEEHIMRRNPSHIDEQSTQDYSVSGNRFLNLY